MRSEGGDWISVPADEASLSRRGRFWLRSRTTRPCTPMVAAMLEQQVKYMADKIAMKRCGELRRPSSDIAIGKIRMSIVSPV